MILWVLGACLAIVLVAYLDLRSRYEDLRVALVVATRSVDIPGPVSYPAMPGQPATPLYPEGMRPHALEWNCTPSRMQYDEGQWHWVEGTCSGWKTPRSPLP